MEIDLTNKPSYFISVSDLLEPESVAELTARRDLRETGYEKVDGALSGGLAPGDLMVIAGRPGVGKSVAMMHWARNLAARGRSVAIANYEHSTLVLLAQLLLIEVGELVATPIESVNARSIVDRMVAGQLTWSAAVTSDSTLRLAATRLGDYAHRIRALDIREDHTEGAVAIERELQSRPADILVVDHLQKLGLGGGEAAAFTKRLGVRLGATVLAAATTSDHGIAESRIRSTSLTDAASIAHEADVIITLNDKLSIVSQNHAAFDSVRAESFRSKVVFTIEKNRRGPGGIDLEFTRDFPHRRFKPDGAFVTERLVDNVLVRQ